LLFFIQFFLCGIFTSLLFPPFFLLPIGFIVFPYLFYLLSHSNFTSSTYKNFFLAGFLYGLGFFSIYIGWIKEPFLIEIETKNYFLFGYILIFYCSFYFGVIFLILKFFNKKIIKLFMIPSLIVVAEYICANFAYGFPWFSFSLIYSTNFIGTSLIFYLGTYGLSYVTILFFLLPCILFFKNKNFNFLFVFNLILILLIFTFIFLRNYRIDLIQNDSISISIVQTNYGVNQHLEKDKLIKRYNEIVNVIKNNKSDIIIFSENEYPYLMNDKDIISLQNYLNENQSLVIGSAREKNNKYYNSFFLINKKKYKIFDKQILVPFGEFIPFRKIFFFMESIAGTLDFKKGNSERLLELNNNVSIIPVICYEMIYFWKLINSHNQNGNLIINLTNDSWFGNFSGPYQHFYFSKLRAAEFNKNIIRVSNNGVSGFINRYGELITHTNLNEKVVKNFNIMINPSENNYLNIHKLILSLIFSMIVLCLFFNKNNESKI